MARARTANGSYLKGIRAREAKALDHYVSIVSRLPFVEEVRAKSGYEAVLVWTVIDSEPFANEPRDQIYGAELQTFDQCPKALLDYRLINRLEYGDEKVAQVLPDDAHVAWRRADQP